MAEAILVVKIDSEGNVQAIKQANEEIAETGKASKGTSEHLGGLKKAATFAAGAFAAIKSAQAAVDFVKMGANVQAVEQRFVAFAGGAQQAQQYMEAFAQATDGTVDRVGAMAGASKMLQMQLVDSADEMETMAAIAVKLGDQTMGASDRLADFSALLANRSIPRLDNFGISSGKVRERVEELTDAGYELDEAFKLAVLEEGQKSLDILGDTSEMASTKIAKVEAAFADLKTGLAVGAVEIAETTGLLDRFAVGAEALPDTLQRIGILAGAAGAGIKALFTGGNAAEAFTGQLRAGAMAMADYAAGEEELRYAHIRGIETVTQAETAIRSYGDSQAELEDTILKGISAVEAYEEAQRMAKEEEQRARDATQKLIAEKALLLQTLTDISQAELARVAMQQLTEAYEQGRISASQYRQATFAVQVQAGLLDAEAMVLHDDMGLLIDRLSDGEIGAYDFASSLEEARNKTGNLVAGLSDLAQEIADLPGEKKIRIITEHVQQGSPGAHVPELSRQHGGPAAGLTLIHGPELIELPRGSYVHSPEQTRRIMQADLPPRPLPPVCIAPLDPGLKKLLERCLDIGRAGPDGSDRTLSRGIYDPWNWGGYVPRREFPTEDAARSRCISITNYITIAPNAVRSDRDIEVIMEGMERIMNLRGARVYRV
jgi:hypothetical protein